MDGKGTGHGYEEGLQITMVHVVGGVCTENIDVTHKGFCENVEFRDWHKLSTYKSTRTRTFPMKRYALEHACVFGHFQCCAPAIPVQVRGNS